MLYMIKSKGKRVRYKSNITTLDDTHKKKMQSFQKGRATLPKLQKKLSQCKSQLNKIHEKKTENYTVKDIKNKSELSNKIQLLKKEINTIQNNRDEIDYWAQTHEFIFDYYDQTKYDAVDHDIENPTEARDNKKKELTEIEKLNLMNQKNYKIKKKTKRRARNDNSKYVTNGNIMNQLMKGNPYVTDSEDSSEKIDRHSKAYLYNQYLMVNDHVYACNKTRYNPIKKCFNCGSTKKLNQLEGIYTCHDCGETEEVIVESEKPAHKDSVPEKAGYPYQRKNHLNEWLSQFQAKQSTDIPDEVFEKIKGELKKNRLTKKSDIMKIDLERMKDMLKKLDLSDYYDHVPYILSKLKKKRPPTISREMEERIRAMFAQIQEPFKRHCPPGRVNFLSYSYVLHKFCELLELDEFLGSFLLLKSPEKLREQDIIWKKICSDLKWQYIPSHR